LYIRCNISICPTTSDITLYAPKIEDGSLNYKGGEKNTTQASAKKVYAAKVCRGYLGIAEDGCNAAFDLLIDNMKRGYEALAPTNATTVSAAPADTKTLE
jgi:hypothetical protein